MSAALGTGLGLAPTTPAPATAAPATVAGTGHRATGSPGASGFLLKDTQPAHLVAAIRTIAAGAAVLAPGATSRLVRQFAASSPLPSPSDARVGGAQVGGARVGGARVGGARVGAAPVGAARVGAARVGAAQMRQTLTSREQDVFARIAGGMSNSEIAASLFLRGHREDPCRPEIAKLGLRDRVQAAVLAYESRLIIPGTPLTPGTPPPDRPSHPHQ